MPTLALDRSMRRKDQDGRLYVENCRLSKATVNGYKGSELKDIPGGEDFARNPDRIFQLWRHPEELEKAASTWNGVPLLSVHKAHSAEAPIEKLVAGAIGTNCRFEAPYLVGDLVVWRAEDIADIESCDKCELSAAYYYRIDPTPGNTPDGMRFDGI